jgi:hypothetical protein
MPLKNAFKTNTTKRKEYNPEDYKMHGSKKEYKPKRTKKERV